MDLFHRARRIISRARKYVQKASPAPEISSQQNFDTEEDKAIAFPLIDLATVCDPLPAIMSDAHYKELTAFFLSDPAEKSSLTSTHTKSIMFTIIRNLKPDHVVELGTFKGGTTKAMCRAVLANENGVVHTVGPYDSEHFLPHLATWPPHLQSRVKFYPIDSMAFVMEADRMKIRPGLVFVDGNHDYEFALFDIQCAARAITPGGFIVVDNISQSGPYYAVKDFLSADPDWTNCGAAGLLPDAMYAFDRSRGWLADSDLAVIRAPMHYAIRRRPRTFGEVRFPTNKVRGMKLALVSAAPRGELYVQCVLRGFGKDRQDEAATSTSRSIGGGETELTIEFENVPSIGENLDVYRVEPWLTWVGDEPLLLGKAPTVF